MKESKDDATDTIFKVGNIEVQDVTQAQTSCFEIRQQLSLMDGMNSLYCF
jgi:hypothetical protein